MFGTLFYGLLNLLVAVAAFAAGIGVLLVGGSVCLITVGCTYCEDGSLNDIEFVAGITYSKELTEALKKMADTSTELCSASTELTRMMISEKKEEDDWCNSRKTEFEAEDFSED